MPFGLLYPKIRPLMHQSIPSTNIPPSGQPQGIFPNFQPGSRDLYHLNYSGIPRGSNLLHNVKVLSCQLMPHEGTFQLQTDVPSLCCSLVTKSVWKLGENFKTLSMVLKLKLKDMTWTAFQFLELGGPAPLKPFWIDGELQEWKSTNAQKSQS